jgi:hypothetical protein
LFSREKRPPRVQRPGNNSLAFFPCFTAFFEIRTIITSPFRCYCSPWRVPRVDGVERRGAIRTEKKGYPRPEFPPHFFRHVASVKAKNSSGKGERGEMGSLLDFGSPFSEFVDFDPRRTRPSSLLTSPSSSSPFPPFPLSLYTIPLQTPTDRRQSWLVSLGAESRIRPTLPCIRTARHPLRPLIRCLRTIPREGSAEALSHFGSRSKLRPRVHPVWATSQQTAFPPAGRPPVGRHGQI